MLRARLEKLAWLLLLSALTLSGIIFMPKGQHAFWAAETFSVRLLGPGAAVILLALGKTRWGWTPKNNGAAILYLLIGSWFLSAGFAFRKDLAARELAIWLCYPGIFVAAWTLGVSSSARSRILFFIMLSGAVQALYGLLQAWGIDPISWAVSYGGRTGGFLGNPNFLGGHLAMLLPLSLALAMDNRGAGARSAPQHGLHGIIKWALAGLLGAALIVTQTRGAFLGAAAGLALFAVCALRHMPGLLQRNRKALLGLFGTGLLVLAAFFAAHPGNLERLKNSFNANEEMSRRMTLLRCSLELVKQHPALGVGPGNFRIFFPSVQASGLRPEELTGRPYIVSEHAHNDLIQMAADAGLPAAFLWLALLFWLARALWRGAAAKKGSVEREDNKGNDALLAGGTLAALVALGVHGLANFPFLIAPSQITAWALAAIGLRAALAEVPAELATKAWVRLGLGGICFFLWFLSVFDAGRMLLRDGIWWRGNGELQLKNSLAGRDWTFKALNFDLDDDRLWALYAAAQAAGGDDVHAIDSWTEVLHLNPHDHETRVKLGRALAQSASYAAAETVLAMTAKEAPNFKELWEPFAASLFMQAKLSEAMEALNMAETFEPQVGRIQLNMALCALKLGDKALANAHLRRVKILEPENPQILQLEKALR